MRCMTLCIYLWDVLYAIATDPGIIAMVQGFGFSMKIRGFTPAMVTRSPDAAPSFMWPIPPADPKLLEEATPPPPFMPCPLYCFDASTIDFLEEISNLLLVRRLDPPSSEQNLPRWSRAWRFACADRFLVASSEAIKEPRGGAGGAAEMGAGIFVASWGYVPRTAHCVLWQRWWVRGGARWGWWWRRCSVSPVTRWGRVLINIFLFRFFVHALIVPLGSCERFFCADFIGTEKLLQIPPTTPIMSLRDLET
jgi:hypothetical protein